MVRSFKYRIRGAVPKLEVHIWQHVWPRLMKALLWSAAWASLAYVCVRSRVPGVLPLIGAIICAVLSLIGLSVANYSVQWSTLWLGPDLLRLRIVRLFARKTTAFPLPTIRDFGFGMYSHGGPVLKLDVGGTWFVLASGVREDEVYEMLAKIRQHGYSLCYADSARHRGTDSVPTFWTLD